MANSNPVCKFNRQTDLELAPQMTGVRLPLELDAYVRSLPNKSEWLRAAIAEKYAREVSAAEGTLPQQ